ncbi:hypothetical protein FAGKG844_430021 [Frankia sp. AgKG'84/4]
MSLCHPVLSLHHYDRQLPDLSDYRSDLGCDTYRVLTDWTRSARINGGSAAPRVCPPAGASRPNKVFARPAWCGSRKIHADGPFAQW